jgi:hypothetical protein
LIVFGVDGEINGHSMDQGYLEDGTTDTVINLKTDRADGTNSLVTLEWNITFLR